MHWLQIRFNVHRDQAAHLEQQLEQAGALSVTLQDAADDPLFEPGPGETPLWQQVTVTGLFPAGADAAAVQSLVTEGLRPLPAPAMQVNHLGDREWQRAWMDDFKPRRFGQRLWVCPSWHDIPDPSAANLLLDPGLAFGTGTHPTTALCLEWLDANPPIGESLIDYGCGSGILGIAALLLGAANVHGVDNDRQALSASRENCRKNGIEPDRFTVGLPGDPGPETVDGVMANILAKPLIDLAEPISRLIRPGGWLMLSGILEKQAEDVMTAYRPWCRFQSTDRREEWVRLNAVRKPDNADT